MSMRSLGSAGSRVSINFIIVPGAAVYNKSFHCNSVSRFLCCFFASITLSAFALLPTRFRYEPCPSPPSTSYLSSFYLQIEHNEAAPSPHTPKITAASTANNRAISVVYLKPSSESKNEPTRGAHISPQPPTISMIEAAISPALLRDRIQRCTR